MDVMCLFASAWHSTRTCCCDVQMDANIYTDVLDYKHKNLTDNAIDKFLAELQLPANGRIYLDLSFNRFTEKGLEKVISLMENHTTVSELDSHYVNLSLNT